MTDAEASANSSQPVIAAELLEILVCPACHAKVELSDNRLICQGCGRKYPIEDGIPIMLIDQAEL